MTNTPLTGAAIMQQMTHAIDGADPSSELDLLDIANQAGEWFYNCHDWRFKTRPGVALATVSGQSYIELPDDFGEMIGIPRGPTTNSIPIRMTTLERIAAFRSISSPTATTGFFGAIAYVAADQDTQTPPTPRLEIWPPPSSSDSNIATLYYTASWTDLDSDDSIAAIPRYCKRIYIEAARIFLTGLEDEAQGTTDQRLDGLYAGRQFAAAIMRDQGEQSDYGTMATGPAGIEPPYVDPSPNSTYVLPGS